MGKRLIDYTGHVSGRLTVKQFKGTIVERVKAGHKGTDTIWICVCECGKIHEVRGKYLQGNRIQSCGCLKDERQKQATTKHNMTHTPEYGSWHGIKDRCYNVKSKDYGIYGARGILVCDRWRDSFNAFVDDMGLKPSPAHSIDRIDVNKNYEPSNCRWATPTEQSQNRRNSVYVTFFGERIALSEFCRLMGKPYSTVYRDVITKGKNIEELI